MSFDNFLDEILSNVMSAEGIERAKECIKNDMKLSGFNYDTTKVESQVYEEESNYTPRVEISSEGYNDGEVIFIDYYSY